MLQKFEIQGVHTTVTEALHKYVTKKIGNLDRYIMRQNRDCAHTEVFLKEGKTKNHNHCTCEVTMHLPQQTIIIKESAMNMYAAVDIVEAKLKQQLQKYKDLHHNGKNQRRMFARFRRQSALEI
jgi:putative sigma-54 modulation protein